MMTMPLQADALVSWIASIVPRTLLKIAQKQARRVRLA